MACGFEGHWDPFGQCCRGCAWEQGGREGVRGSGGGRPLSGAKGKADEGCGQEHLRKGSGLWDSFWGQSGLNGDMTFSEACLWKQ